MMDSSVFAVGALSGVGVAAAVMSWYVAGVARKHVQRIGYVFDKLHVCEAEKDRWQEKHETAERALRLVTLEHDYVMPKAVAFKLAMMGYNVAVPCDNLMSMQSVREDFVRTYGDTLVRKTNNTVLEVLPGHGLIVFVRDQNSIMGLKVHFVYGNEGGGELQRMAKQRVRLGMRSTSA